ncbi:MAG: ABC transporter ATP-binding protein [Clostridiales bacterium]|jgi:ABC-2 type transport system ATP-binding protein|nr:ABC transporter ATP-binding protein [Clostridiales bacterium]
MCEFAVKANSLSKKYQKKTALDGLTFAIQGNGITGLVGRNGSGKTTLLKLCAGLLDVTKGELLVFGGKPMDNLSILSKIVYTYHNLEFEKSMRLHDIMQNYKIMFPNFDLEFAEKLLRYFELKPQMKYIQLSQGMASTFNFICGLACRAPLTMFDEPVLGMDVTVRKAIYEVLLRDYTENPRTIIVSSHLFSEIERILSDVILINEGKLLLHESIDDLQQSAYMLEGEEVALKRFTEGKNVIWSRSGETGYSVVIYETFDERAVQAASEAGFNLSAVRTEDLCVYLTQVNKEVELECLWKKAN